MNRRCFRKQFLKNKDWIWFPLVILTVMANRHKWLTYPTLILVILYIGLCSSWLLNYRHSRLYLMWKGGEKWRRFKRMYRYHLYVEKIVMTLMLLLIAFIIGGLMLKQ